MEKYLLILPLFVTVFDKVHTANIVFYFGVSSYSHRVPAWPLAEALAEKGHNVTFVSPYPSKSPNQKIKDFVPKKLKKWSDGLGDTLDVFQDRKNGNTFANWVILLPGLGKMVCDVIYSDDEYLNWIKDTKVDLVFIDGLFNDCAYGMAHYWNAKIIIFQTSSAFQWFSDSFGLPDETNWIADMALYYPVPMTFTERTKNALMPIIWNFARKWRYFPYLERLTKEKLNLTELTPFEEIERNVSMVFLNTHYSEEFARSVSPNVISVGGIAWTTKRKPLPKDLDDFLKRGSGFIYLSFGTHADFNRMDISTQQAIIGAIRSFPTIQFVWKVGNESLAQEFPDKNVYIGSWMPQQDILAHPKIKTFITHSGLLGTQEAIYSSVPLISFPVFAEQDYNAERIHRKEYGIRLEITTVTQSQLEDAINRVLNDPKYRDNMKKVSKLFQDRPQKPLETAIWWTDFVLRHNQDELSVLRPLSLGQSWWIKRQLDVWITIFMVTLVSFVLTIYFIVAVLKYFCGSSNYTQMQAKKMKMQ